MMSAGPGNRVVFIHGAILSDGFVPMIEQTGIAENFQVVHYRRRGYAGSSRALAGMTMQGWAGDRIALLNHLGIASAHVAGASWCVLMKARHHPGSPALRPSQCAMSLCSRVRRLWVPRWRMPWSAISPKARCGLTRMERRSWPKRISCGPATRTQKSRRTTMGM